MYGLITDGWYTDELTFQSGSIKKTFTGQNVTCSYQKPQLQSFVGQNVIYTQTMFPGECCGMTGTGGPPGKGGLSGYYEFKLADANTL